MQPCPICKIMYANLPNHMRLKHASTLNTQDVEGIPGNVGVVSTLPPTTPNRSNSIQISEDSIRLKELLLQDKRLDIELAKLDKGTTASDPWDRMFAMMQENNKTMLEMSNQINDAKLENLELRLSAGGDSELGWITQLLPYLPQIFNKGQQAPIQTPLTTNTSSSAVKTPLATEKGGNVKMDFDLSKVPKAYLKGIKSGKITQEQAWTDLQSVVKPELLPTREDFNKEFERIKNKWDTKN